MSKTLTKEAKIHLATKVDNYEDDTYGLFIKDTEHVTLHQYNPNQPDSPLKYLKALIIACEEGKEYHVEARNLTSVFSNIDRIIGSICKGTGFKGKVWDE